MIVIMIDEFDQFLLNIYRQNDTVYQIDKLRDLIKLINDRDTKGIKSIVFAGSFGMITMLENGDLKIKRVIEVLAQELSQESQHKKQPHSRLQQPVGIFPSPLNSVRIIEASDFTKEQHIKFFHDIQVDRNLDFSEKVVDIFTAVLMAMLD